MARFIKNTPGVGLSRQEDILAAQRQVLYVTKDDIDSNNCYYVMSNGTNWYYSAMTLAS